MIHTDYRYSIGEFWQCDDRMTKSLSLTPHPLWSNPGSYLHSGVPAMLIIALTFLLVVKLWVLSLGLGWWWQCVALCHVMSRDGRGDPGMWQVLHHALSGIRGEYYELWLNSKAEDCVIWTIPSADVRISPPVQVRQSVKHLDREVWIPLGAGTGRILTNSTECNSSQQFGALKGYVIQCPNEQASMWDLNSQDLAIPLNFVNNHKSFFSHAMTHGMVFNHN